MIEQTDHLREAQRRNRSVSVTDWDIDKMESYAVKVNEGVVNE